jgi:hypothetical protein
MLRCSLNGPIACVIAIPAAIPRPNAESESRPRLLPRVSWIEQSRGADALFNTLVFLSKIIICGCRVMRDEQPENILRDINKLMKSFAVKRKKTAP